MLSKRSARRSTFDESFLEKLEAGVRNYNTIHAKIIPSIKFIIYQGIPLIDSICSMHIIIIIQFCVVFIAIHGEEVCSARGS